MGTGKTITTSVALRRVLREGKASKALIICPSSVKFQWQSELTDKMLMWDTTVITGNIKKRRKLWNDAGSIIIMNYETLLSSEDFNKVKAFKPDVIIVDEAHYMKSPMAQRTKAILRLNPRYKWLLTGTPLENKPEEIYTLVNYVQPGLLDKKKDFTDKYVVNYFMPDRRITVPIGYKNLHELHETISPYMLRRLRKDVLSQIPKRRELNLNIDMTPLQKRLHKRLVEEMEGLKNRQGRAKTDTEKERFDEQIMGKLQYLIEVADAPELLPNLTKGESEQSKKSPKLKELIRLLKDKFDSDPNGKVVIFTQFRGMQRLISEALDKESINHVMLYGGMTGERREQSKKDFNNDVSIRVFLTTDAGKEGLNLQIADTQINFDLPWKPSAYNQRAGRIERMGSVHDEVLVVNMIASCDEFETIDVRMWKAIQHKQSIFDAVVDGKYH